MKPHIKFYRRKGSPKGWWYCTGDDARGKARKPHTAYNDYKRKAEWYSKNCPGNPVMAAILRRKRGVANGHH